MHAVVSGFSPIPLLHFGYILSWKRSWHDSVRFLLNQYNIFRFKKLLKEVGVAIQSMRESRRRPLLGAIGWCLRRSRPFGHRGQGAALCLRESNLRAALVCLARTSDRSGCQALARAIGYVRFANCLRRERSQNV